jgi:flavodoxin I
MKILVVYDTLYGNTEKIARVIADAVGKSGEVKVLRVGEARPEDLAGVELLFVGSPTQGGQATKAMQALLDKVPAGSLKNVRVAPFDTRMKTKLLKVFGYAAGRIEAALKEKGGTLAASPGMFLIKGSKGPLEDGEEARAVEWARGVIEGKGQV